MPETVVENQVVVAVQPTATTEVAVVNPIGVTLALSEANLNVQPSQVNNSISVIAGPTVAFSKVANTEFKTVEIQNEPSLNTEVSIVNNIEIEAPQTFNNIVAVNEPSFAIKVGTGTGGELPTITGTGYVHVTEGVWDDVASKPTYTEVGADAAGAAATVQSNLNTHANLTTTAHGGIVANNDTRLSDARTPLAHASTHSSGGSDPITINESQVTNLTTALASKVAANTTITPSGLTNKIVQYDSKGLVLSGLDATTNNIPDSTNKRYVTDAQLTIIQNTSGVNTGDKALSDLGGVPTTRKVAGHDLTSDIVLTASEVGADIAGAAATVQTNLTTHTNLTTTAHGGIVASTDSRLSDARTPLVHATSHITGNDIIPNATQSTPGLESAADKTKLDGIQANATVGADWNVNVSNKPALGTASTHSETDFDVAGAATIVQNNLAAHIGATGTSVHGLGTAATHSTTDFEAALGNPSDDGYVLSSTANGVRSWIQPISGGGGSVDEIDILIWS